MLRKKPNWIRRANILYIFCAWNAFGLVLYEWSTGRFSKDEKWSKLDKTQKYLSLMSSDKERDKPIEVIRIKGLDFKGRQTTTKTVAELIDQNEQSE